MRDGATTSFRKAITTIDQNFTCTHTHTHAHNIHTHMCERIMNIVHSKQRVVTMVAYRRTRGL